MVFKSKISTFLKGILAGLSIALGGFFSILCNVYANKILGSIVFPIGLFLVCKFSFMLYTGKIGYVFEGKIKTNIIHLLLMYLGNIIGAVVFGLFLRLVKIANISEIANYLSTLSNNRSIGAGENIVKLLISSMFCGAFVYFAVYSFKNNKKMIFKIISLFVLIALFVYFGFEHVIANAFYFAFAGSISKGIILNIIFCTIGNSTGAILCNTITKINA